MTDYFSDIHFRIVLHHELQNPHDVEMCAESNSFEFIFAGHLILEKSGREIDVRAPACFWIKKGEKFRFLLSENEKAEHFYFDFSGERSDRMMRALDAAFPAGCFQACEPEKTEEIFREMLKLYRCDPVGHHADLAAYAEMLLALACRAKNFSPGEKDDRYALDILAEQLRGEPFADYDFSAVAAKREITIDHLRRLFRARFDCTPREYLAREKLLRAAEMLRNTHLRVKEIQYTCRFATAIDFSRAFRKRFGVSPREYRAAAFRPKEA
ncbi:MAG: helix-turn-helix transcriptional regulator [Victivallaceae bacterium]|nr:helix-turn-helix transcriptional regulator [Victivallaceae bacterium]